MARIVIDGTPFLYQGNGVSRVTEALILSLHKYKKQEDSIDIYCRAFKGTTSNLPKDINIKRYRIPKKAEPIMQKLGFIEKFMPADLYHATDHYLPLKYPEKSIVTIHDLLFKLYPNPDWPIHQYLQQHVPNFVKRCKKIVAISEHTKKDIVEQLNVSEEKIVVIPWAVNTEQFFACDDSSRPTILDDYIPCSKNYFLAISCSTKRKNTPRLLAAYERINNNKEIPDLVLAWNPPEEILKKYNHPKIHFIGKVSEEQLVPLIRHAKAMIYPSLYEGFGLPILEAQACNTAVLSSNQSCLPDVAGDAALLVDPTNIESIAQGLYKLSFEPLFVRQLQEKGLENIKRYSWEKTTEAYINLYREAIEA
ncbi:MAG: glycosyltransferase family 4 protein [Lentisphaeria bacterium]|nr:glycosyltransferase family 4 protein [Lentisphaeria bacterium]